MIRRRRCFFLFHAVPRVLSCLGDAGSFFVLFFKAGLFVYFVYTYRFVVCLLQQVLCWLSGRRGFLICICCCRHFFCFLAAGDFVALILTNSYNTCTKHDNYRPWRLRCIPSYLFKGFSHPLPSQTARVYVRVLLDGSGLTLPSPSLLLFLVPVSHPTHYSSLILQPTTSPCLPPFPPHEP